MSSPSAPSSAHAETPAEREVRRAQRRQRRIAAQALEVVHRKRKRGRAGRARLRQVWLSPSVALVRCLPLRVAAGLGDLVGRIGFAVMGRARRRVLSHLELAFGEELDDRERRAIARRNFRLMGRAALSFFTYHRLGTERALARVRVDGEEHLQAALAKGRGAILVGAHYGLVELAACWYAQRYGGAVVGRPDSDTSVMSLLYRMREELGCPTIRRGDPREILRRLRRNEPIGILADHAIDDVQGAVLPFFGRPALTVTGPAALAHRTGAPLVPVFIEWDGPTSHRVIVRPALVAPADLPRDQAILALTERVNAAIEARIRSRPDHWSWLHKRWALPEPSADDAPAPASIAS